MVTRNSLEVIHPGYFIAHISEKPNFISVNVILMISRYDWGMRQIDHPKVAIWRNKMLTLFIFILILIGTLYGLINYTEKVLSNRQQGVEEKVRIVDHRSRL